MTITRQHLADKIGDYLEHRTTLDGLVAWAEDAQLDGDYEEKYFDAINEALSKIRVANVENFELGWEDYEHFLARLGYSVKVKITQAA